MKIILAGLMASLLTLAVAAVPAEAAQTKSKAAKQEPKTGEAFSDTGTVTKNEADICMVTGLRYFLHPSGGEEVKIYPKSKHDSLVLDQAIKNKSSVRVTGTWKQSLDCHYVEIKKIEKLKK